MTSKKSTQIENTKKTQNYGTILIKWRKNEKRLKRRRKIKNIKEKAKKIFTFSVKTYEWVQKQSKFKSMQKGEREEEDVDWQEEEIQQDENKWWMIRWIESVLVRLVQEGVSWPKHALEFCRFQQSQPIQEDVVASFESKFKTKEKLKICCLYSDRSWFCSQPPTLSTFYWVLFFSKDSV